MHDAMYGACADVLILATQLQSSSSLPSPPELRQRLLAVLERMVASARQAGIGESDIAEARYALVAFLDEQILKSNWPQRAEWWSQLLQLALFRENTAGENFFARLRALLQQGNRPLAIQAYYLCLTLGFRGFYGDSAQGTAAIAGFTEAARQQLGRVLPSGSKISPNWKPRDRAQAEHTNNTPLIALLAGCVIVASLVVGGLSWALSSGVKSAVSAMPAKPVATLPR